MVAIRREEQEKRRQAEIKEVVPGLVEEVRIVARQLEILITDPENKKMLRASLKRAENLASKLIDTDKHLSPGVAWEKAAMLLSLSAAVETEGWAGNDILPIIKQLYRFRNEKQQPNLQKERSVSKRFLGIRQLLIESGIPIANVTDREVKRQEKSLSEKPQDMINAIAMLSVHKTLRLMLESGKYYENGDRNKPLIRLPINRKKSQETIKVGYQSLETDSEIVFGGIAVLVEMSDGTRQKVPIVFQDTAEVVTNHEKNHRDFPGLKVGGMRSGLDEAITNHLAIKQTGISYIMTDVGYPEEGRLLSWLGKDITDLLVARYKSDTIQTGRSLAAALINEFGFAGYVELFQTHPQIVKTDEQLAAIGALGSGEVHKRLKRRTSLFKTMKRWV